MKAAGGFLREFRISMARNLPAVELSLESVETTDAFILSPKAEQRQ